LLSAPRVREHRSLFASLLAVVVIVTALGTGLIGYLGAAADDGVRAHLATRSGTELGYRLSLPRADDLDDRYRRVAAVIADAFTGAGGAIPVSVYRSERAPATVEFTRLLPDGSDADTDRAIVTSIPEFAEHARLVHGSWVTNADEAVIQVDAAERLGLGVGDRIRLGEAELTIVGTWRISDPVDGRWLGDPLITTGRDEAISGPIVVDADAWNEIGTTVWSEWTIVPDRDAIAARDLDVIDAAWSRLGDDLDVAGLDDAGVAQEGGFSLTAQQLATRVHALDAVTPVALLIIAAIAIVTLLELARLLGSVREVENELLWSRGATAGAIARSTATEAAIAAVLGGAIGTAVAAGVLLAVGGREAIEATGAALWLVPATTVALTVIAFGAQSYVGVRRTARRDVPERSGRTRRVAGGGLVVLVGLAAAISVWQLQLYGSPVTPVAGGGTQVDPVTVVAPALALVALVLAGLLVFPFIAPLAERIASRRLDADRVLAARSIARRLSIGTTPLLVAALATGGLVVAGGYSASWQASFTSTQELGAGTSTRVTLPPGAALGASLDAIAGTPGVTGLAAVAEGEIKVAGDYAAVLGIAPAALAALAVDADGVIDPRGMADSIDVEFPRPTFAGDGPIAITVGTEGLPVDPELSLWVTNDDGLLREVPVELDTASGADSPARYTGTLPAPVRAGATWRLAAVDLTTGPGAVSDGVLEARRVDILGIEQDGEPVPLGDTFAAYAFGAQPGDAVARLRTTDAGHGAELSTSGGLTRMLPVGTGDDPLAQPIPMVVSSGFADRIDVAVGDPLPLLLVPTAPPVTAKIADVVVGIPGTPDAEAVLVDIDVLNALQLRSAVVPEPPRTLWIGADDPTAVAGELRTALPHDSSVHVLELDPDRAMLGSAAIALWIAALGCAVLALAAIGAVVGAQLRSRRGEVVVLRAIGLGSREQGAIRRRELAFVAAYGGIAGLVAGFVVVLVTIAPLARAAVPNAFVGLPTLPLFETIALPLAVAAVAGLVAVAIAIYGSQVTSQARTLSGHEVER
jgi:hypothetical protein